MAIGIAAQASGDAGYVPFYVAAADFIDTAMRRLHEQDVDLSPDTVKHISE